MKDTTNARYAEWLASLFGACPIAFSLGVWLASIFVNFALIILILGILLHGYGMYKTYQRDK